MSGKAAGLMTLQEIAPVPRFFVLTDPAAADVRSLLLHVDRAGLTEPFAVRSSADIEDQADGAFAGMFETRLAVPRRGLHDAVQAVSESAHSPRVKEYSGARRIHASPRMSVIIQEMVDARVAGVCVTRLPEAHSDVITVESVWGLGETLVSGAATPDIAYVDRVTRRVTRGDTGTQMLELRLQGGKQLVPPHLRSVPKLTDSEVLAVAMIALAVEKETRWPGVDIEWAFDDAQLWALQARQIASLRDN